MTDEEITRTQIRIPSSVYKELIKEAAKSGRSMNAEMVQRLESTLDLDPFAHVLEARQRELASLQARRHHLDWEIDTLHGTAPEHHLRNLAEARTGIEMLILTAQQHIMELESLRKAANERHS